MRHARAPGTGDPTNFDLNDCATQRNLSEDGRRQAVEIGARFRDHDIARAAVYSSAWCRCRETADLLGLGTVETLPALNSFFGRWDRRDPQTAATLAWLAAYEGDGPLVLVTHQVNIRALTGAGTRSGEMVVARRAPDGEIVVLGRL
jgi:broad specificity phosphatase PhoE